MKLNLEFDETSEIDSKLWQEICDSAIAHNFDSAESFAKAVLENSATVKVTRQEQIKHDVSDCLYCLNGIKECLQRLAEKV